ncbi:MAG: amidohydrolase, partial [Actinomycetota bacterium]|nr:amidohydrolase [Actinomycetota bacterium]
MIDLHQHLWPAPFVAALRARRRPPRLDGWALELFMGDRWAIDPAAHDPVTRPRGEQLIALAPSAALGIDRLAPAEAAELAEAWLAGVLALGGPYAPWATAGTLAPDPAALTAALGRGAIGLE